MIKTLLSIRFRALFAGMTAQGRQKKKRGIGMTILFAVLYLYVAVVLLGAMGFLFYALAEPYHIMNLDWLYFAMCALMGLGFSVIGSVFTTQSQLYDARDNPLLLAMPIPPKTILLSRMIPLLALNVLNAAIVMVPATVVYAIFVACSPLMILEQVLALIAVVLLSQAIACLLGWVLHMLLSRLNKSLTSMVYMVVFLALYFYIYSQAGDIMNSMIVNSDAIAETIIWVWPIYALGKGSAGQLLYTLGGLGTGAVCFLGAYAVLSATFLKAAVSTAASGKRKKLDLSRENAASPRNAIVRKELRKFLSTPVYLTNMGLGLVLMIALSIAGIWFRKDILPFIEMLQLQSYVALLICGIVAYLGCTICISCPSVSLEGKNIWILKSMPIPPKQILLAKLELHNRLSMPVTAAASLILSMAYGCSILDALLCTVISALLALLIGLVGMNTGLKWAKLDYISEAYPCKQSAALLVTIFGSMGLPLLLGLLYGFVLADHISPTLFMVLCTAMLAAACFGLYRLLITWGARKWISL